MKMKTDLLKDFVDGVARDGLGVHGVVVRQHGEILDQHDILEEGRIQLFSASKTWTAMAVGIAMHEGLFKITDTLTDLLGEDLPEKVPEGYDRITVERLLTMSTGHAECPITVMQERMMKMDPPPFGGDRAKLHDLWYDAFFDLPLTYAPEDKHFVYNNGASYMLSIIVQKKSGLTLRDYLMPRIFEPLKIEDPEWDMEIQGHCLGALGLHLTTEELSRGGQLLLNGGKWNGVQLIPEDYVKAMGAKQVDNDFGEGDIEARQGYGYQMWRCTYPGAYRMDGMFGQFSIQLPDKDAVVAITSRETNNTCDILRMVWNTIVPKL